MYADIGPVEKRRREVNFENKATYENICIHILPGG